MALVMALVLKGFLVDAYRIPTGSMQPTLVGDERSDLHDRILVDRLTYALRAPRRFEVAVFRYPLDRSRAFVKRVVGIGPEEVAIQDGDLFRRDDASQPWTILRRPEVVQEALWLALEPPADGAPAWEVETAGRDWSVEADSIVARGDGRARLRTARGSVRDGYLDGYAASLREHIRPRPGAWGRHDVGDLRLDATVEALAGTRQVTLELFEGARRYAFRLPGPAAAPDERARVEASEGGRALGAAQDEEPWRLEAGRPLRVRAQNLDDRLELRIEGRAPLALEVAPAQDQASAIALAVGGAGAVLRDLCPYRDVYYTSDDAKRSRFAVPEGSYLMLGDNAQDSSDGRDWQLYRIAVPGAAGAEPAVVRGDARPGENPRWVNAAELEGPTTLFTDEWGEEHWIPAERGEALPPVPAPFVERDAILGRAVAVFWPLLPTRGIVRLGLVR